MLSTSQKNIAGWIPLNNVYSLYDAPVHITVRRTVRMHSKSVKEGLHRICCGVNRLGDIDVHILGDTSAFVNPAGQLLITRRGKTIMDGVA